MMRKFGLYGTVQWGERLHALQLLIAILAPSNLLWLTVIVAGFRYDMPASIREVIKHILIAAAVIEFELCAVSADRSLEERCWSLVH